MARIEREPGVLAAWTDRHGGVLVVATRGDRGAALALVRQELAGRSNVVPLASDAAAAAIGACLASKPGWYRARETLELSKEEARVLAARGAKRAAEIAGLEAAETARLEASVREACERVFAEHFAHERFDGHGLDRKLVHEVGIAVDALDLPAAKREALRQALADVVR